VLQEEAEIFGGGEGPFTPPPFAAAAFAPPLTYSQCPLGYSVQVQVPLKFTPTSI